MQFAGKNFIFFKDKITVLSGLLWGIGWTLRNYLHNITHNLLFLLFLFSTKSEQSSMYTNTNSINFAFGFFNFPYIHSFSFLLNQVVLIPYEHNTHHPFAQFFSHAFTLTFSSIHAFIVASIPIQICVQYHRGNI